MANTQPVRFAIGGVVVATLCSLASLAVGSEPDIQRVRQTGVHFGLIGNGQ